MPNERKAAALIFLVLALGTLALYWPVTTHPFSLYDDDLYVASNPHVTTGLSQANFAWAFTNTEAANWHPLTWLSHQLDCQLFGPKNAGAQHFVNVLFHVANTLLVFIFLRGLTGALWRSALVAALFAWHPLHVESVAWLAERKDVLSAFFFLLTLIAYTHYVRHKSWIGYALALVAFALGLLSKPMVVTLPFVLLLLDFWPLQRFNLSTLTRLLLEKIPFFLLTLAGCVVTYLAQSGGGALWQTTFPERLANAAIAYARYAGKFFCPTDLALVYSLPRHWPVTLALTAALVLVIWTYVCLRDWRRRPYLITGWFWFLGILVPTIGLVQVGAQAMADRYSYLPGIGFCFALVWGVVELAETRPALKKFLPLLGGTVLAACVVLSEIQISYWRDDITLFRHAMNVSPDNYVAANCLGKAYERNGDLAHARILYQLAVETEPRYPQSQFNYAMVLLETGASADGLQHLQAAAALEPHNPDIQYDLGIYYSQHQDLTNALTCFSNTVALRPGFAPAHSGYAAVLEQTGNYPAAAEQYREAGAKEQLQRLLAQHPDAGK